MTVRWTPGTTAAILFAMVFLVVQFVVPIAALFGNRPGRLGWQMYSTVTSLPDAWTLSADGSLTPLHVARYFAQQRAEIDYRSVLATDLCEATGAFAIRLQDGDGQRLVTIQCQ